MHGRITEDGSLQIDRAGKFKQQWCPYVSEVKCGHFCPKFNERATNDERFVIVSCGGPQVYVKIDRDERKAEQ